MPVQIFTLPVDENITLKVSIWQETVHGSSVFYAKYININLDDYIRLSQLSQESSYGITYREENNGPIIYYRNLNQFLADLRIALVNGPRLTSQL